MLWPSSEPPHRDGSDEGSQHMVAMRNKIIIPQLSSNTPSYQELWFAMMSKSLTAVEHIWDSENLFETGVE